MEKLEHPLWIVDFVNAILGPPVRAIGEALGYHFTGHHVIPNYLVMVLLIVTGLTVLSLIVRSRLSVENPGKLQIVLEDGVRAVVGLLEEWIGPKGAQFLPLIATLGAFILVGNYMGLVPGLMAPTSNINVTLGCALTTWVFYHYQGIRAQGIGAVPHALRGAARRAAGARADHAADRADQPPLARDVALAAPVRQHLRRGAGHPDPVQLIPWLVPLPMMLLGLVTGGLQAFIFMLLSIIYLQGAVAVEHEHDEHGHDAPHGHHAPAAA